MNIGTLMGVVIPGLVGLGSGAAIPVLVRTWCPCSPRASAFTASTCAILFAAMAGRFDEVITVVAYWVMSFGLLVSTTIDILTHRLPREVTYATVALGAPLLFVSARVSGDEHRMWTAALGASVAFAVMGLFFVTSRGGLGDGDVRFSPLLGFFTGWSSLSDVVDGLFLGFTTGAIWGVGLMIVRRAGRKTAVPFGPFLALGAVLAVLLPGPLVIVP